MTLSVKRYRAMRNSKPTLITPDSISDIVTGENLRDATYYHTTFGDSKKLWQKEARNSRSTNKSPNIFHFISFLLCIYLFILGKSTNSGALNSIHRLHANLGSRFQASLFLDSICTTPPAVVAETLSQHTQKFVHSSCCCLHILYEQGKPGEHFLQSTIHTKSYNKRIFGLFLL